MSDQPIGDERAQRRRRAGDELPTALIAPARSRLAAHHRDHDTICAVHATAVAAGQDGYVDPASGMFCFTARYHWDKGYCCELGCRHCPWVDADERLAEGEIPAG